MSLILQLETSTEICSVAISENGILLSLEESKESNSHTEIITKLIENCLKNSGRKITNIDAVAISDGPGSYTSLRVGTATAKGICYALDCPLIAIDSLSVLAKGIPRDMINGGDIIIPMIDARRMEVYTCIFDKQLVKAQETNALILEESSFNDYDSKNLLHFCGSGAIKFRDAYNNDQYRFHHFQTSAKWMTELAYVAFQKSEFVTLAYYSPNYLKPPNITKSNKKLF